MAADHCTSALVSLASLLAGIVFILPLVPMNADCRAGFSWTSLREFTREIAPITTVIAVLFGLLGARGIGSLISRQFFWPEQFDFPMAVGAGIIAVVQRNRLSWAVPLRALLNRSILSMIVIVVAVMIFKGVLVTTQAIDELRGDMAVLGIPPLLIIALLPLISGFVTGLGVGFVGPTFPLGIALFSDHQSCLPFAVLAYGFGFGGMMLSPIHLCLVVSQRYFCVEMMRGYRYLWKPVVSSLCGTVLLFLVYRVAFG